MAPLIRRLETARRAARPRRPESATAKAACLGVLILGAIPPPFWAPPVQGACQDGSTTAQRLRRSVWTRSVAGNPQSPSPGHKGQPSGGGDRDPEGGPHAGGRREVDLALVALDDHQDRGEAEPGALPLGLRRHEGLEEMALD